MSEVSNTVTRWLRQQLDAPAIVAPMFLVSGPDLVIASCRAGLVGSFPTLNARTPDILDEWLRQIRSATHDTPPFAANLILHKSNERRDEDLSIITAHEVPLVLASVGSPALITERVHGYGGLVFSDVASVRHARKAVEAGADGLILLTAGAGGNTGWLNPFAFTAEVRRFYEGPLVVAGGLMHGHELRALEVLGADLGYMGTRFLASRESMAPEAHKEAIVRASADDVLLTDAISGLPANFLRTRLQEAGVLNADGTVDPSAREGVFSYKNVWSAGHGVAGVDRINDVATIAASVVREYRNAC